MKNSKAETCLRTFLLLSAVLAVACAEPSRAQQATAERARTFASLPNWTGLWQTEEAAALLKNPADFQLPALWGGKGPPPYNSEWKKKTAAGRAPSGIVGVSDAAPTAKACAPWPFPADMASPVPDNLFELLVTQERTLLLSSDGGSRHIYTDGRSHPKADDLWPTPMGDSIGHWDGETLVVETIARTAGPTSPLPGSPSMSEKARFTERIRRIGADMLQDEMTIDDPERFSHSWQVVTRYLRVKDVDRMIALDCAENDRNPVINGHFVIAPPAR
jgi:hypothetical protein